MVWEVGGCKTPVESYVNSSSAKRFGPKQALANSIAQTVN